MNLGKWLQNHTSMLVYLCQCFNLNCEEMTVISILSVLLILPYKLMNLLKKAKEKLM